MMDWKQWRDRFIEQADTAREQFRSFWTQLAPRERLILGIAAGMFAVVSLGFIAQQIGGLFLKSGSSLEQRVQDAHQIQKLMNELKSSRFQARRYDRLREQRPEDFQLEVFIENQARRFGVTVEGVSPRRVTSAAAAQAEEKIFEVRLADGISLDASLRFLESVEEALGVRIIELTMKPQFEDPSQLNVDFVVAMKEVL